MTTNEHGVHGNVLELEVVMVAPLCECTKNHRTARFKMIHFMICAFYFNFLKETHC